MTTSTWTSAASWVVLLLALISAPTGWAQTGELPVPLEQVLGPSEDDNQTPVDDDDTADTAPAEKGTSAPPAASDDVEPSSAPPGPSEPTEPSGPTGPSGPTAPPPMAPVEATAKGAPSPSSPADAAPAEKQPDLQQKKWQPLPEGKLFHEEEPEPEPLKIEPPKMDATDIESGSATLSTWSLLPVQAAVGWMTAVAMLPVTFCTCGLGGCLTPAVTTFAQVSFGDYSSDQRGSLFGPLLATHCVYGGCVGTPIALWAAAVAALAVGMPVVIPVYVALSVVALWAPFVTAIPILLGATVLVATAGALSYALVSEPKEEGDADVRFPGFFSPAHKSTLPASGDDDPSPTPPETAMAY